MKKIISSLLVCCAIVASYVPVIAQDNTWKEFYVSANGGDDANPGTKDAPFATLAAAQQAVRKVNQEMQGDIVVNIDEGHYFQELTLDLRTEDSGFNGHRVIWRGAGEGKSVISAGERVTGFKPYGEGGIYVADYDTKMDNVLQLSVNDEVRYLAKSNDFVKGARKPAELDTEDWFVAHPDAPTNDHYNYYEEGSRYKYSGFYMSKEDIGFYKNPQDMFFRWDCMFHSTVVGVHALEACEDPSLVRVVMQKGAWNYWLLQGRNDYPRPNREFHMYNALELLDEPGEFYYDRYEKKLYYMPMEGENLDEAVVVAARHSAAMMIDGYDVDKKVQNLTFEGLAFSDSRWDLLTNSFATSQASVNVNQGDANDYVPACVLIQRANNIEFKNNIIRNTGAVGIFILNAVTNMDFVGNVVHDTGDTGICVGAANHADLNLDDNADKNYVNGQPLPLMLQRDTLSFPVPEEHKNDPIEIGFEHGTKIFRSYHRDDKNDANGVGNNAMWGGIQVSHPDNRWFVGHKRALDETWDQNYKIYDKYWKDDVTCQDGKKPWVRWEFIRPYTIDEIVVSFNTELIKDGQNSDFEVLLSNDREFNEGNYTVVATQNGVATEDIIHYKTNDDTKYQYMMIRKTKAEPFALSKVWIQTYDEKPFRKNERCQYINIENNLITRCGGQGMEHADGICVTSFENSKIINNHVEKVGYSGIAVGYQWNVQRPTVHDSEIAYNRVVNTNQNLLDGGPIYTLGAQLNTRYHHNYLTRANHAINNFYTDNGTSYAQIDNNYMELGRHALAPYVQGGPGKTSNQINNVFDDNYGTYTLCNDDSKEYNVWEDPIQQVIGQPTKQSYDVYANAGLKQEYDYLWDYVPEATTFTYHHYDANLASYFNENSGGKTTREGNIVQELKAAVDGAKFGTGLGVYPLEYQDAFSDALAYFNSTDQPDWTKRFTQTEEFIDDIKTKMRRYSYADTLKLCEDVIAAAKEDENLYPADAIAAFTKTVEKVKASSGMSEYDALTTLENAYNEINAKMASSDIASVSVAGADDVIIDKENKHITVYMPLGESFEVEKINITPEGGGEVARLFGKKTDISKDINIPIFNPGNNEYVTWTLRGEYAPVAEGGAITGDVWTYDTNQKTFIRKALDGSTMLRALNYAYMSTVTGGDNETAITFSPHSPNTIKSFTMILGANRAEGFDYGNIKDEYNRCEVVFNGDTASFYKVAAGKKTLINSVSSGLKWNEKNDMKYEIKEINDNTHFKITLNGKTILSEVIQKCSYGRYIGFYSPKVSIRVY